MFESSKEKDPVFGGVFFYTLVNKHSAVEKNTYFFYPKGLSGGDRKAP